MLKKTIAYEDYNGVQRKEDFYFNLSHAELLDMQGSKVGGLDAVMRRIVDANDAPTLLAYFKDLVLKAYGEKSEDGRRFMKKAPDGHLLADDFAQTEAYSQIYVELATNAQAAAEFVNGIVPADISKKMAEMETAAALSE